MQGNNESMMELSEILKNLVQDPIKSIYQENISEDIKKINRSLKAVSSIKEDVGAIFSELDGRFDEVGDQVNNVFKQNGGLSNKIDEVSKKLAVILVESQSEFDKASKQAGDVTKQNNSLSEKLEDVSKELVKVDEKCDRVLEKTIEADKQFENILTGSIETLGAISSLGKSIDLSYRNLDRKIDGQGSDVLKLLKDIGRIYDNTNQTKALVDELIHSNAALSESLKNSALREESMRKAIKNNRWVVAVGTLLISSIIIVFEMNLLERI